MKYHLLATSVGVFLSACVWLVNQTTFVYSIYSF